MSRNKKVVEYPIKDEHRLHYAQYPTQIKTGKWVAVDVLKTGGYISPYQNGKLNPSKGQFDDFNACWEACKIHNNWLGFTQKQVLEIVAESMARDQPPA